MIRFKHVGDFSKATLYLKNLAFFVGMRLAASGGSILDEYGRRGVEALSSATPLDSGKTANSWSYKIEQGKESVTIAFYNSNENEGVPIAIILQYGHGTGTGGWVEGRDYINPAIQPIFDEIADEAWREVTKL